MTETELDLREGWVDPGLGSEFPELSLTWASVEVRPRRSPRVVKEQLRALANRYTGAKVIHMRQDPVPWAYRVFARQVGIDPDSARTPVEAIALERLRHGGLRSENLVDDAITLAVAETGVPLIALDADLLRGRLGLRLSLPGESLTKLRPLSTRQIVLADEARPLAVVLGEVSQDAGVTPRTERIALCALGVKGVPRISVEEALWLAAETLYTEARA